MHVFVSVARVSQEVSSVNSVHPPRCCTYDSLALFMHVLKILLLFFFFTTFCCLNIVHQSLRSKSQ